MVRSLQLGATLSSYENLVVDQLVNDILNFHRFSIKQCVEEVEWRYFVSNTLEFTIPVKPILTFSSRIMVKELSLLILFVNVDCG